MSTSLTDLQLYANNVFSTIAVSITQSSTSISLNPGSGSAFPYPTGDQFFLATLDSEEGIEVVKCTSRVGDTLQVERGQEGTDPSPFPAGTMIQVRVTKGTLERMARLTDRLYDLDSVDDLPSASTTVGNSFICKSSDEEGNPIIAVRRENLWRFLSHNTQLISGTALTGGDLFLTADASAAVEATPYLGRYLIQFTSGPLSGLVRLVTGAAGGRLEWTKPLPQAVPVGASFTIYLSDAYQFSLMADLGLVIHRSEFGLGGTCPMWTYPTMNAHPVPTGFYQVSSSNVTQLPETGTFGVMVDLGNDQSSTRQVVWNKATGRTYSRVFPSTVAGWQPWRMVYDQGNTSVVVQEVLAATTKSGLRTTLELGSAATKNLGYLAGDVMSVGSFGLGSGQAGVSAFITDGDSLSRSTGFYTTAASGGAFTQPSGVDQGGSLVHFQRTQAGASAQAFQIFTHTSGRMFYRYAVNNVWQTWNEFYHSGNLSVDVKEFLSSATSLEARTSIGATNAGNLTSGTVPTARLPSSSEGALGVSQFATLTEALTQGSSVMKTVSPGTLQAALKRQFNPQTAQTVDWDSVTEPGLHPYALNGNALHGPGYGSSGAPYFFCMVYKQGTSPTANLLQIAYAAEEPLQDEFSNNRMLYRSRTNGLWGFWISIVDVFNYNDMFNLLNPSNASQTGFLRTPTKICIQWGRGGSGANNNESAPMYFPVAYAEIFVVLANHGPFSANTMNLSVSSLTNSYFTVRTNSPTALGYSWIAIGRLA